MPYSTPEDFFKDMETNILEAVKNDTPKPVKIEHKKRPLMRVMWTAMLAVAASAVNRKIRGFSDWTVTEIYMLCDHYQQKFEFLFRNNKR